MKLTLIRTQRGQTLIECLIALTLNAFILIMVLTLFMTFQQHCQRQWALSRLQENARITHQILSHAIKTARFLGCERIDSGIATRLLVPLDQNQEMLAQANKLGVISSALEETTALPSDFTKRYRNDTDILWINGVDKPHVGQYITDHGQVYFALKEPMRLKKNDVIVLSDCAQATLFLFQNQSQSQRTRSYHRIPLPKALQSQAVLHDAAALTIGQYHSTLYYIGDTHRTNSIGDPVYALYTLDLYGRHLERVEGVEDMVIEYGIKLKQSLHFMPLNAVRDWKQVVAVKVKVLFSSIEAYQTVYARKQSDRVLRQWWQFVFTN